MNSRLSPQHLLVGAGCGLDDDHPSICNTRSTGSCEGSSLRDGSLAEHARFSFEVPTFGRSPLRLWAYELRQIDVVMPGSFRPYASHVLEASSFTERGQIDGAERLDATWFSSIGPLFPQQPVCIGSIMRVFTCFTPLLASVFRLRQVSQSAVSLSITLTWGGQLPLFGG